MVYGLPRIAVDQCAMSEIGHGETGLIAKAEDVVSLADAMIQLGRNPRDTEKMGAAGRRKVEADYTWGAVTAKIKKTLETTYGI